MGLFNRQKNNTTVTSIIPPSAKVVARNNWLAATSNRLTSNWYTVLLGPNQSVRMNAWKLRSLSRQLANDDVYTSRYLELMKIHVVGPDGMHFQPRSMDTKTDEMDTRFNNTLVTEWNRWKNQASIDQFLTFKDLEQMAIRTVAMDGEIFFRFVIGTSVNDYGLALMPIDADLLDNNFNSMELTNGNIIVQGIEVDKLGRRVAYHFWNMNPYDNIRRSEGLKRVRIPAEEIIHLYRPDRPTQYRGVPWTATSMYFLARLHEYMDAELVAAQAGASQIGTLETQAGDASQYINPSPASNEKLVLEQGSILKLAPGEKLNMWQSNHPNTSFDSFVKSVLHGIASGFNVSYSTLASDTSEENYASGRLGVLLEREYFRNVARWMIQSFHNRVYAKWVETATEMQRLPIKNPKDTDKALDVVFRSRGWQWADPKKELEAYTTAIDANLISKTQVCAQQGLNYRQILDDRYEEEKLEREYEQALQKQGLPPVSNQSSNKQNIDLDSLTEQVKENLKESN